MSAAAWVRVTPDVIEARKLCGFYLKGKQRLCWVYASENNAALFVLTPDSLLRYI